MHGGAHATRTGNAMGTPAFMPPEQALGNWSEVDARTDLWAVGATLFTLLTGRIVHEAATVNQLLLAAMTKPAPPLRKIFPELPRPIAAAIDRALAFDREKRWPDARSMQRALREARSSLAGFVDPVSAPPASTADLSAPSLLVTTVRRDPGPRRPRRALFTVGRGSAFAVPFTVGRGSAFAVPFGAALGAVGAITAAVIAIAILRARTQPAALDSAAPSAAAAGAISAAPSAAPTLAPAPSAAPSSEGPAAAETGDPG